MKPYQELPRSPSHLTRARRPHVRGPPPARTPYGCGTGRLRTARSEPFPALAVEAIAVYKRRLPVWQNLCLNMNKPLQKDRKLNVKQTTAAKNNDPCQRPRTGSAAAREGVSRLRRTISALHPVLLIYEEEGTKATFRALGVVLSAPKEEALGAHHPSRRPPLRSSPALTPLRCLERIITPSRRVNPLLALFGGPAAVQRQPIPASLGQSPLSGSPPRPPAGQRPQRSRGVRKPADLEGCDSYLNTQNTARALSPGKDTRTGGSGGGPPPPRAGGGTHSAAASREKSGVPLRPARRRQPLAMRLCGRGWLFCGVLRLPAGPSPLWALVLGRALPWCAPPRPEGKAWYGLWAGGQAPSPRGARGLRSSNPFTRRQEEEWRRRNRSALAYIAAAAVGMVGMSYAAVPLYRLYCQVPGSPAARRRRQFLATRGGGRSAGRRRWRSLTPFPSVRRRA